MINNFFFFSVEAYPSPDDEGFQDDGNSYKPSGQPPKIITQPLIFRSSEGERLNLPCEIINKGKFALCSHSF